MHSCTKFNLNDTYILFHNYHIYIIIVKINIKKNLFPDLVFMHDILVLFYSMLTSIEE